MDNTISENTAYHSGGGFYCEWKATPTISKNMISDNSAEYNGGAIYCWDHCSPTITSNTISGNETTNGSGGGISTGESSPSINNNIISDNLAKSGGGIYCFWYSSPNITNNTVIGNTASNGGGICCDQYSSPSVLNTILWGNTAVSGPEIWIGSSGYPSTVTIRYSDVQGGQSSCYVDSGCTLNWGAGMIDSNPLFVTGPKGDYYLSQVAAGQAQDSPCVNTGNPSSTMIIGTTRTDEVQDSGVVDMGYHYPLP
jgi:parallel beta-helix repeat protein/predicted outer membrane repeat protein